MKKILCLFLLPVTFLLLSFITHKQLTWTAIGDSITYLNDHLEQTGYRVREGYLSRVTDELPYIKVTNQGHNGWTTGGIARALDKLGLQPSDIYTVFLGTNDWWHSNPIGQWSDYTNNTGDSTIYGAWRKIIDRLRSLNKDAHIVLITPMQRGDFVQVSNPKNNAYGSYKEKAGQTLEQVVTAVMTIAAHEKFDVLDLYHNKELAVPNLVKYKRLKDPQTGEYKNYSYPDYTNIPFNPETDEYPYPTDAIGMTYDGLHPSDSGNAIISKHLIKILKKF